MCNMSKTEILQQLKSGCADHWRSTIDQGDGVGKLHWYSKIKQSFHFERYLDEIHNVKDRHSFTQLRISAHKLEVETGRYSKTPRQNRICKTCNSGICDEIHFLTKCAFADAERQALFAILYVECKNFTNLNDSEKSQYMLVTAGSKIQLEVAKFCFNNFEKRKENLSQKI